MSRNRRSRTCPACGGKMRRETRADMIEYKNHKVEIDQPAWWCQTCDEAILEDADNLAADQAFKDLRAEVDGVLTAGEVAAIRQRLGLSQRQAGLILGGGPRAFQKIEAGATAVSQPMSNLLRLLDRDPARLRELMDNEEAPVTFRKETDRRTGRTRIHVIKPGLRASVWLQADESTGDPKIAVRYIASSGFSAAPLKERPPPPSRAEIEKMVANAMLDAGVNLARASWEQALAAIDQHEPRTRSIRTPPA